MSASLSRRTLGGGVLALAVLAGTGTSGVAAAATNGTPWFGVISPTRFTPSQLVAAGVRRVTLSVGWDVYEPSSGTVNTQYVSQLRTLLAGYRAAGMSVVLDPGLQYPPSWVFSLPGQTRFVNQYGDTWRGPLSEDVPDYVFNPALRQVVERYLRQLAIDLGASSFVSVRVGGLLSGELRYPLQSFNGHNGCLWGYGSSAQAGAPRPGWTPGTGTTGDAAAFLQYYCNSLSSYAYWLLLQLGTNFPRTDMTLVLPSWGLRPGMAEEAVAARLTGGTTGEVNGMVAGGLDWVTQVAVLAHTKLPATVYTTWLDAPDYGTTPQLQAPVRYLATLAAGNGLPLAGENTGGGGSSALQRTLGLVAPLPLTGVMWMNGDALANNADGLDLRGVSQGLRAYNLA